ncbi:ABC transporter permease [Pseudonocardia acaciae]|uniref:ABC transporter permease n=1 Tax=Pseudonocardia acaciae TaxID=551276 RepID=UPI000687ED2C|nr:ABC transporter permease [Pseudonocardia acaciae]
MARGVGLLVAAAGVLARRVALLVTLLAVVFAAVAFLPGDAAAASLERGAGAAAIAARRAQLGLDRPLVERFARWMGGLVTGDMGVTARGQPISSLVWGALPNTLRMGALALLLTVVAALALGCWAALRPGGPVDRALGLGATVTLALPEFVVGSLLVLVFALWLGLLPAVASVGSGGGLPARAVVLPVLAIAIPQIGWNTRLVRAALAEQARLPHVDAAVLDGLPRGRLLVRHLLPGALPAVATSVVASVGLVLGGTVVSETVFNIPGLGAVLTQAVTDRDAPLVAGVVAVTGALIMVLLVLADGVRAWATWGTR